MAKHYVKLNKKNEIVAGFSGEFLIDEPLSELTCITKEGGRHFEIEGSSELKQGDIFLYRYEKGKVVKKTEKDIQKEEEALLFPIAKENKLKEIKETCDAVVEKGFTISTSEGDKSFSLTQKDQINLMGLSARLQSGDPSLAKGVPYHANGDLCKPWSIEEFTAIANTATSFVFYHTTYVNHLKAYILRIDNTEELEQVWYGMPLPEDLENQMKELLGGVS